MEELNNRQIVLLCMLVSFVVSIATGIITVAMLEEAPQTITQTVNRVVERTIERVVPDDEKKPNTPPPVTTVMKEVTVLAKEDDLIVSAVEKNQPRIASIYLSGASTSSDPLATGFVVSRDGLVVTASRKLLADGEASEKYLIVVDGKEFLATPMPGQEGSPEPVYFLRIVDLAAGQSLDAVSFGSSVAPKVAQTVIVIGGAEGTGIFKTTISKLRFSKAQGTTTPAMLTGVETQPKIPEGYSGALAVNLDGQVVGIVVWIANEERSVIYPGNSIFKLVGSVPSGVKVSGDGAMPNET